MRIIKVDLETPWGRLYGVPVHNPVETLDEALEQAVEEVEMFGYHIVGTTYQ